MSGMRKKKDVIFGFRGVVCVMDVFDSRGREWGQALSNSFGVEVVLSRVRQCFGGFGHEYMGFICTVDEYERIKN